MNSQTVLHGRPAQPPIASDQAGTNTHHFPHMCHRSPGALPPFRQGPPLSLLARPIQGNDQRSPCGHSYFSHRGPNTADTNMHTPMMAHAPHSQRVSIRANHPSSGCSPRHIALTSMAPTMKKVALAAHKLSRPRSISIHPARASSSPARPSNPITRPTRPGLIQRLHHRRPTFSRPRRLSYSITACSSLTADRPPLLPSPPSKAAFAS